MVYILYVNFFFQAEDGIRDLVRSRGLGDVYKRQVLNLFGYAIGFGIGNVLGITIEQKIGFGYAQLNICLLYTSDAADERSSVDLGGRRIIKKKNNIAND